MATIRLPQDLWSKAHSHLFSQPGEHFAFFLAHWAWSHGEPVFMVRDIILIPDSQTKWERDGLTCQLEAILFVINSAVKSDACLIEAHNHGGQLPRFSVTDRAGLREFPEYIHQSLPGRPYAATVWGNTTIYGEYFLPDGRAGVIAHFTIVGQPLRQIVSRDDDLKEIGPIFDRQLPWFTSQGQQQLGRLRVAVIGSGGTGSQVIQNLAYLGCRDMVLVDSDEVDETNLNRLVTATPADMGTSKTILGRRLVRSLTPNACVRAMNTPLQSHEALDTLKGVDCIFGCVDNDGARLILNELALAYGIPYFDLAVGIEAADGIVSIAGGRVAIVLPSGPCLKCMGEIDVEEASYFLAPSTEQAQRIKRGYVRGVDIPAPAVVSLNAAIAAMAVNEFAVLVSGIRPVNLFSEYDLMGSGRPVKGQWLTPAHVKSDTDCVQCAVAGLGDKANVERYAND